MKPTSKLRQISPRWNRSQIAFALATLVLIGFAGSQPAPGQSPDRDGWSGTASSNQPGSIDSMPRMSTDVRAQIGLAIPEPDQATNLKQATNLNDATNLSQATFTRFASPPNGPLSSDTKPTVPSSSNSDDLSQLLSRQTEQLTSPDGLQSSIKIALLLATLSLAPAIVLMSTCYIRVVVVLSLLKQAFGGQALPPTQVVTALSLFMTFLIMTPVWTEIKTEAIDPYTRSENPIGWEQAWQQGVAPVRSFMIRQIQAADNEESVAVFYRYLPELADQPPTELDDVPIQVLLPAFMISELKVAFLLGFQVFLPFLVVDLVVSSVTVSMGMVMLPPNMVSFPLKLVLFVMVDGWNLVVGMLLQSFGALA